MSRPKVTIDFLHSCWISVLVKRWTNSYKISNKRISKYSKNYGKLTFYLKFVWAQKALVHVFNIYVGRLCGVVEAFAFQTYFIFCGFLIYHLSWKPNRIIWSQDFFRQIKTHFFQRIIFTNLFMVWNSIVGSLNQNIHYYAIPFCMKDFPRIKFWIFHFFYFPPSAM